MKNSVLFLLVLLVIGIVYQIYLIGYGYGSNCIKIKWDIEKKETQHYMSLKHLSQFTVEWIDHRIGNIPLSYCKEYGK